MTETEDDRPSRVYHLTTSTELLAAVGEEPRNDAEYILFQQLRHRLKEMDREWEGAAREPAGTYRLLLEARASACGAQAREIAYAILVYRRYG